VGRSCFELSKLFDEVIGIDYSKSFIDHCNKVMLNKTFDYECKLEGNLTQKLTGKLDRDVDTTKIKFEVGDACNLREDLGSFDLVLASNLICRLTEPMKFLNRLKKLVKPNGYVILSTPFTWGKQFTPEVS
jgi:SAM-dependent methyltransferase